MKVAEEGLREFHLSREASVNYLALVERSEDSSLSLDETTTAP